MKLLNPTISLRAGQDLVVRPSGGGGGGRDAIIADNEDKIDVGRSPDAARPTPTRTAAQNNLGTKLYPGPGRDRPAADRHRDDDQRAGHDLGRRRSSRSTTARSRPGDRSPGTPAPAPSETIIPLHPAHRRGHVEHVRRERAPSRTASGPTPAPARQPEQRSRSSRTTRPRSPACSGAQAKNAIVPFPRGRFRTLNTGYYTDPQRHQHLQHWSRRRTPTTAAGIQLLDGASNTDVNLPTAPYGGNFAYNAIVRERDFDSTTPWQPGSTLNWVQALFYNPDGPDAVRPHAGRRGPARGRRRHAGLPGVRDRQHAGLPRADAQQTCPSLLDRRPLHDHDHDDRQAEAGHPGGLLALVVVVIVAVVVAWRVLAPGRHGAVRRPTGGRARSRCARPTVKPVTEGSVEDQPFADVVVGATALPSELDPAGAVATLFAYQPREGISASEFSGAPLTAAGELADPERPAVRVTEDVWSVGDFVTAFPATYDGYVQLRLYLGTPAAGTLSENPYDTADLRVDGDRWELVRGGSSSCADALASCSDPTGQRRSLAVTDLSQGETDEDPNQEDVARRVGPGPRAVHRRRRRPRRRSRRLARAATTRPWPIPTTSGGAEALQRGAAPRSRPAARHDAARRVRCGRRRRCGPVTTFALPVRAPAAVEHRARRLAGRPGDRHRQVHRRRGGLRTGIAERQALRRHSAPTATRWPTSSRRCPTPRPARASRVSTSCGCAPARRPTAWPTSTPSAYVKVTGSTWAVTTAPVLGGGGGPATPGRHLGGRDMAVRAHLRDGRHGQRDGEPGLRRGQAHRDGPARERLDDAGHGHALAAGTASLTLSRTALTPGSAHAEGGLRRVRPGAFNGSESARRRSRSPRRRRASRRSRRPGSRRRRRRAPRRSPCRPRAASRPPTGKVQVVLKKGKATKTVTGTVKAGTATVKLPKLPVGKWTVDVTYAGRHVLPDGDVEGVQAQGQGRELSELTDRLPGSPATT